MTVLGPDLPTDEHAWTHVQLNQSSIKGRKASSLAKSMRNYLEDINIGNGVLLIDWALVKPLSSLAKKRDIRWVCMDRSPPADANFFLQKCNALFGKKHGS